MLFFVNLDFHDFFAFLFLDTVSDLHPTLS